MGDHHGSLTGLWIFKKTFGEGENFVLFGWTLPGSAMKAVSSSTSDIVTL